MNFFKKNKPAPSEAQHKHAQQDSQTRRQQDKNSHREQAEGKAVKKRNLFSVLGFIALGVLGATFYLADSVPLVATGQEAASALNTGVSETLGAGVRLLENDGKQLPGRDYNVTFRSGNDAGDEQEKHSVELLVWDYAAVDGDYVQILKDHSALSDAFMIKHAPQRFQLNVTPGVPVMLQIKGVRDGGGGITYAAMFHYKQHHITFYNQAPEAGSNTYTVNLIP